MTNQSDPLLREVDEALRHDRLMEQWQQYRMPLLIAAIVFVVVSLGFTQWRNYREAKAGNAMEEFAAAQQLMKEEKFAPAAQAFSDIAQHSFTHELADLAHLWQARALSEAKQTPAAIQILQALVAQPQSKQRIWRDIACIRLATLDAAQSSCLALNDGSPLNGERSLLRAAQLWHDDHAEEARLLLQALLDNTQTPESVRENARRYLAVIAPSGAALRTESSPKH